MLNIIKFDEIRKNLNNEGRLIEQKTLESFYFILSG